MQAHLDDNYNKTKSTCLKQVLIDLRQLSLDSAISV